MKKLTHQLNAKDGTWLRCVDGVIVVTTRFKPRFQSPVHLFQSCAEGSTELGLSNLHLHISVWYCNWNGWCENKASIQWFEMSHVVIVYFYWAIVLRLFSQHCSIINEQIKQFIAIKTEMLSVIWTPSLLSIENVFREIWLSAIIWIFRKKRTQSYLSIGKPQMYSDKFDCQP